MSKQLKHYYAFGPFRLDAEERILWQDDEPLALPPKVFETLVLLVEHRGRIVSKEEMMSALWADRFVEESNLTQSIFMLRKALGDGQDARYVETVPRRGYRFVAPVRKVQEEVGRIAREAGEEPAAPREAPPAEELISWRDEAMTSLAILPLVNESQDPEVEYLASGITDGVMGALSQLSQVRVVARSLVYRPQTQEADALQIGRKLGADAVLAGRILVLGRVLVIRVELIEVATGWQLWGERYQRPLSDLQTVQEELSANISEKLRLKLSEEEKSRLSRHFTQNPEAYQSYLKGRYYWNKHTGPGYRKAIEYFEEATRLDPHFALAHSGLADSYVAYDFYGELPPWETGPKAKAAAISALVVDDTLAEAHTSLACVKMMYERDWSNAEREFRKAIELDPNYAHARNWYSHFLMAMGRIEESLAESRLALQLDPLSETVNQYLGWHYIHARQFDRAIAQLEKTLKMNPEFFLARATLGMAYVQKGEFEKAIEEFGRAQQLYDTPLLLGFRGHACALKGDREGAQEAIRELKQIAERTYVPAYTTALIHTALGENEEAFEWFEEAYAAHNEWVNWIKVAPEVDSLRAEPRFRDLLRRLDLAPDK
ncbi:MAG TPA: tetratricopeptide repeat protein [Pyrinomonadaceae bacterium]|jgi:DNA-binding winged helix-turn-helix (wHTH) protein/tetratricopeptide (TPR) repeat protein